VLLWLGRAFSVMAQSRRLVVTGPYSIVRHPLYLCEEISVLGIALAHLSIAAVLIVLVQWMFQLRRMTNEEHVIEATFPEYADYATRTPKILPHVVVRKIRDIVNWR
jgi:protein-S-isoprenylcysteine O-methyltransferase Ste14